MIEVDINCEGYKRTIEIELYAQMLKTIRTNETVWKIGDLIVWPKALKFNIVFR